MFAKANSFTISMHAGPSSKIAKMAPEEEETSTTDGHGIIGAFGVATAHVAPIDTGSG